jgi:hypothetical protein
MPRAHILAWLLLLTVGDSVSPQTFRSPDGTSQFIYPSAYTLYTGSATAQVGGSYIAVCQSGVACVVYPKSKYAGTNFEAASFEEREIDDATTESACLTSPMRSEGNPEFSIAAKAPRRIIHGVRFLHGISSDAGLGHYMGTDLYRAFHKRRCYELSINLTTAAFANFDPGTVKEFTREDEQRVRDELTTILDSFRFLK